MKEYYLAVDIGASSGRHILGWKEKGQLKTQEVYRFENSLENRDGYLCWDTEKLFAFILEGMRRCKEMGKIPVSMGIDTWAVDFVLLDEQNQVLGQTVGYRDKRTEGMDRRVWQRVPPEELYERTGIQKQMFNSIYQLEAIRKQQPKNLEKARNFLLFPDYFHYLLTGVMACEYTNATTTQLVSPSDKDWDRELLEKLGYPKKIFPKILKAGTPLGDLRPEIQEAVGFNCQVTLPATHDTGSAVVAVPALEEDFLYISSGTWSLMGTECEEALVNRESREANFTNEGGYGYRFRYQKNIMGLWMIQSVKRELENRYGFEELCRMAEEKKDFPSRVEVNDGRFLSPDSMTAEIQAACREKDMPAPGTPGELAAVIYQSLADCYAATAREIEELTGKSYPCIYIVGGGSNARYLNQLTADRSGKAVFAGPGEGTAMGNLAVQMLSLETFWTVDEARQCIFHSFPVEQYVPGCENP
ncbi:MAG: rhamnulokinase [Lachnospiraceae bacterium]|jgi:rhamnulokinase|nr:rhamnulokinase [Lachnospiraceae bacterium]MCI8996445.1 rhamnulokinase [Lachnospiraceae bacterium]MCI9134021.1 rhamnulokinase [Lachnospiraceae bacterium]